MQATSCRDDKENFRLLREELLTAVTGCILDVMSCRQFVSAAIGPLQCEMKIADRALPTLEADIFDNGRSQSAGSPARKAFAIMLESLDSGSSGHFRCDVKGTVQ